MGLGVGLWVACAAEVPLPDVEPMDAQPALEDLVRAHFGPDTRPDDVVAAVGERRLTVVDLALWLEHFPGLTVEQAVEDLVDSVRVASVALEDGGEYLTRIEGDARVNGLFGAWLRSTVHAEEVEVTAESVDEVFRWVPEIADMRSVPELVSATHVLFAPLPDVEQDRAWVEGLMASWVEPLTGISQAEQNAALVERIDPLRGVVTEKGYRIRAESRLIFSRDATHHPNWNANTPHVVEPFAAAAFSMQPGEVKGPVETEFGLHFILVHERIAEEPRDETEALRRAELIARAQAERARIQPTIDTWIQQLAPVRDPEVIARISADAMERLRDEEVDRRRRP